MTTVSPKTLTFLLGVCFLFEDVARCSNISRMNESFNVVEVDQEDGVSAGFLNFGQKKKHWSYRHSDQNSESLQQILKKKIDLLSRILKIHVDRLRDQTDQVELVFLVDASASVGLENFHSELNFVRKLLSDFTVAPAATRVAVVTFAGKASIVRNVDQISVLEESNHKCQLLNRQLGNISYSGGGTYTRGALLEALDILAKGRMGARKAVFLITDGFSNGGDPRPAADLLKKAGATVFTFGIRTGNVEELHDIASNPGYTHSYLLDSFPEFEALVRRALHRDLKAGEYVPVTFPSDCDSLCPEESKKGKRQGCCDELASCACGTATGHYACLCPSGYFGSGLKGSCQPCPNGTYGIGDTPGDSISACTPCPDVNHITVDVPATSSDDCICAFGFTTNEDKCEAVSCPKLKVPENGYVVKASACSNVVNAACGVRCKIGFHLTGDSIRLCRDNGVWSGIEPQCLLKTCPALHAPLRGRIRCEHEDEDRHHITGDLTAFPIDTRCQFKCEIGYQLRGSRVRNCLPLSRWDGLKVTCKPIKCQPLRRVTNGDVTPEACTGAKNLPFATNCTVTCKEGFVLQGPENRFCAGRSGTWTQRHSVNKCVDNTPPVIKCPANMTVETLPGKNYTFVNWTIPVATDNTDAEPTVWSKPHIALPWKIEIGSHLVTYKTQDASKNKAKCNFVVEVLDKEPPIAENCVDPPVFLSENSTGAENLTWDEPVFVDNSGLDVRINRSHLPGENMFPLGRTSVVYNATDQSNNTRSCTLNITVEDICQDFPTPLNGRAECSPIESSRDVQCVMTCSEGYAFAYGPPNAIQVDENLILTCSSDSHAWNSSYFPDCSVTQLPTGVTQDGSIILEDVNDTICDNSTTLEQLSNQISKDLESKLIDVCENDIECSLSRSVINCEDGSSVDKKVDANMIRRRKRFSRKLHFHKSETAANGRIKRFLKGRRGVMSDKGGGKSKKKKDKIELKFKIIGKIIENNRNNPAQGIAKLREKIESMTKSGQLDLLNDKTNREIGRLALNLKAVFREPQELCNTGSILKKHKCVKCPSGTFHNSTRAQCQSCRFGYYQNASGSTECVKCPDGTSTRKMHSKFLEDCIPTCQPGYYSYRKRHQKQPLALQPCVTCEIGFYQPKYAQAECLPCPANRTTSSRGSKSEDDCVVANDVGDFCQINPCLHNGTCVGEKDGFSCVCLEHYVGSKCEKLQDPCNSSPCLNEGECSVNTKSGNVFNYTCNCKAGYTGKNCEFYVDECSVNPCQNNGTCVSTEKDFTCICMDGYEGEFCEVALDHCESSPCREGSSCRSVNGTWQCSCKPGFLGRHCDLLPCDWFPCHANSICINIEMKNTTRKSYRCECSEGYTGDDCKAKIDPCESTPCLNGGNCAKGVLPLNYTCECPAPFGGFHCEIELSPNYVMHFTKSGTTDYVLMKGPKMNLTELTVCLWLQSVDTFNYGTVLSYATKHHDNAFTLTDYNGFVLYVNGERVVTDITANDGYWHFLCVTWTSEYGDWSVFVDGILRDNGTLLANGTAIEGNGILVIGQEQDRVGGGFSESESLLGKLSLLDIWNTLLDEKVMKNMTSSCEPNYGSLFSWAQIREHIRGSIVILESPFCRGCPPPVAPFKGNVSVNENISEVTYSCETGYLVQFGRSEELTLTRQCLKQGQWEGYYTPTCTRVKCGFPGYFPRGQLHGKSYLYGDTIHYTCDEGYELQGNSHRICNATGNWSGMQPICIGVTCKNLLAPEDGDIEYIFDEHEREDTTILQVGQQLEYKCDPGFRLVGEKLLTCLESGKWDHDAPTCVSFGCPPPKSIAHGYIASNISSSADKFNRTSTSSEFETSLYSDSLEGSYFYGDIVGFSCHPGYKFQGNHNLLAEFRLQCSTGGTWTGFVPDCVSLQCSWPTPVKNANIFVTYKNDSTAKIPSLMKFQNISSQNGATSLNTSDFKAEDMILKSSQKEGSDNTSTLLKTKELPESDVFLGKQNTMRFNLGTQISIVCETGYELIGQKNRVCLDNESWSNEDAYCRPRKCSVQVHPVIGWLNERASEITFIEGAEKPAIEEGYWKDPEKVSGKLRNLRFQIEGNKVGDKSVFECRNNTNLDPESSNFTSSPKNLTWTCHETGEWKLSNVKVNEMALNKFLGEKKEDICKETTCNPPKAPINGYIVNDSSTANDSKSLESGDSVKFKCRQGYVLRGDEKSTCLTNGTWSTVPMCEPVTCGNPPVPPNAELEDTSAEASGYVFGNMVSYSCTSGYKIFGKPNVRCLASGKWSRMYGKCIKISCDKPSIPAGVVIEGRSYLYQDKLAYICPNGSRKGSITCRSNGKWSELPNCDT